MVVGGLGKMWGLVVVHGGGVGFNVNRQPNLEP